MSEYSPRKYWSRLAQDYAEADAQGFAPVLHPGAPKWFNEVIARLQFRACVRAIDACHLPAGAAVLDTGCGTGRWVRLFAERGMSPVGMDQSLAMLDLGRTKKTVWPLVAADLEKIPFADGSFDGVSAITVVQHIPRARQRQALKEAVRVLRPGGHLILLEVIRGAGPHVFPRPAPEWVAEISSMGLRLEMCLGQEFLIIDRLFAGLTGSFRRITRRSDPAPGSRLPDDLPQENMNSTRKAYWAIRKITVTCSAWLEPLAERVFPANLATHVLLVFRKQMDT